MEDLKKEIEQRKLKKVAESESKLSFSTPTESLKELASVEQQVQQAEGADDEVSTDSESDEPVKESGQGESAPSSVPFSSKSRVQRHEKEKKKKKKRLEEKKKLKLEKEHKKETKYSIADRLLKVVEKIAQITPSEDAEPTGPAGAAEPQKKRKKYDGPTFAAISAGEFHFTKMPKIDTEEYQLVMDRLALRKEEWKAKKNIVTKKRAE